MIALSENETVLITYNLQALHSSLEDTFEQLIKILHAFDESSFNRVPPKGGWTAAQVAEHLRKSFEVIDKVERSSAVSGRAPDEKSAMLESVFMDFTRKFNAADVLQPSTGPFDQSGSILAIGEFKDRILKLAGRTDLSSLCTDVSVPFFGELTQYEWLCLFYYHTCRHIQQLKHIQVVFTS